jgi:hypothetical protein
MHGLLNPTNSGGLNQEKCPILHSKDFQEVLHYPKEWANRKRLLGISGKLPKILSSSVKLPTVPGKMEESLVL